MTEGQPPFYDPTAPPPGGPYQGPPYQGPQYQGVPYPLPPSSGPPSSGPPSSGPPSSGPPSSGPPSSGSPYPPAQGYGPPASGPPAAYPVYPGSGLVPAAGPVIVQIGELAITSSTVHTPAGDIPLRGSTWHVADQWYTEQKIPTWAIILAIVGFCILTVFSLLFLLAKETVFRGTVQITVSNGPQQYVCRLPVANQAQVQHVYQQVNYVRSLATL